MQALDKIKQVCFNNGMHLNVRLAIIMAVVLALVWPVMGFRIPEPSGTIFADIVDAQDILHRVAPNAEILGNSNSQELASFANATQMYYGYKTAYDTEKPDRYNASLNAVKRSGAVIKGIAEIAYPNTTICPFIVVRNLTMGMGGAPDLIIAQRVRYTDGTSDIELFVCDAGVITSMVDHESVNRTFVRFWLM
jgi:hypothetical protein